CGGRGEENEELLRMARLLPPASIWYLREIGDYHGTAYIVTQPLPDNLPFRSWIKTVAPKPVAGESASQRKAWKIPAAPAAPVAPAVPVPPAVEAKPGEFTQFLKAVGEPVAPVKPASAAPPAGAAKEPGEFTRLMQ